MYNKEILKTDRGMKKHLKLLLVLAVGALFTFGFYSCNDDEGYSYIGAFAVVHTDEDGYAESFTLEDGTTLYVETSASPHKPKNERVAIGYNILEGKAHAGYDHSIHLVGYIDDILTKPIIYIPKDDKKLQDSIGYDKLKVFSSWVALDHINFRYGCNTSDGSVHMLNLVTADNSFVQEGDEPIKLEFRRKLVKGNEYYASGPQNVSFKLADYIEANKGKREELIFEITWEQYSGEIKTTTLKYTMPTETVDPSH